MTVVEDACAGGYMSLRTEPSVRGRIEISEYLDREYNDAKTQWMFADIRTYTDETFFDINRTTTDVQIIMNILEVHEK